LAANKRKILENARKLAQKGSKDKALKEYQKLVKLDPKDAKLRLEIGDAYRRWGQVDEAIDTYTKVADQYMKEGFDARAVAVYKQILNLDPERHASYPALAELYERMGLTAEAIGALQTAADGYHKQGKKKEALDLLRRMATIDPANTTSRIKVAELLRQENMNDEAILEYEEVALELSRQGDSEAAGKIYRRILEMEPNRATALVAFARNLLTQSMATEAETVAKRAIGADDQNPDHYELLADVYRAQGRDDLLPEVYRPLADLYRQRGDEDKARDILQRFVPPDAIGADADADVFDSEPVQFDDGSPDEANDELSLGDHSFGGAAAGSGDELELGPELEVDGDGPLELSTPVGSEPEPLELEGADIALEQGADATVSSMRPDGPVAAQPEQPAPITGDPDQLLAEASVYLRYGKRERAVAHLEAILEQEPSHRPALEKLGEAHAEGGDGERAVEYWLAAAKHAQEDGDADAVAVLRGRIETLDPDAAATLAPPEPEPVVEEAPDLSIDVPDEVSAPSLDVDADQSLDVDADQSLDADADQSLDADADQSLGDDAGQSLGDESDFDLDIDLDDPEVDVEDEAEIEAAPDEAAAGAPAPPSRTGSSASLSTTTAQQIQEDLEEADFYMDQGLHDEAEEIYQRVLALAPNHPKALLRLGEVAAARGEDPGSTGTQGQSVAAPAQPESQPELEPEPEPDEVDLSIDLDDEPALEPDPGEVAAAAEPEVQPEPEPEPEPQPEPEVQPEPEPQPEPEVQPETLAVEAPDGDEDPLGLSGDLSADDEPVDPVDQDTGVEVAVDTEVPAEEETGEFSVPTESPVQRAASPAAGAEGGFDLAAELSDVFDDEDANGSTSSGQTDDGFAAVFEAFKRGVSQTLSEADHEAHYDLGIAYKEMGLFGDAIQEFRAAMVHPPRVVECLHMIALCGLDAGQNQLAVEHLEQLLESEGANEEQCLAARFDLGRAHEALGAIPAARAAYEAVAAIAPDFQSVSERLAGLPEGKPDPGDAGAADDSMDAEGFESFDDVMSEVEDDEGEADPGESFHDLIAEVGAEDDSDGQDDPDDDTEDAVAPAAQAEPEVAPEPEAPPQAKKKRKKISFL
jgi:tetratricopeptide (TPR) repeat protein